MKDWRFLMNKTQTEMRKIHEPVMVREILDLISQNAHLNNDSKTVLVDATVGLGGHSSEFIKNGIFVIGFDKDKEALEVARDNLEKACPTSPKAGGFKLVNDNFINIDKYTSELGYENVGAVLFDLGVNTPQLMSKTRGFSFQNRNADLDMRLDRQNQKVIAADLLNGLRRDQLKDMFLVACDYKEAVKLSDQAMKQRKAIPFRTVGDLLDITSRKKDYSKTHPATKAFLALRIAVNSELDYLTEALERTFQILDKKGLLIVISFHSGEDRIVKKYFNKLKKLGLATTFKKPILPSEDEINTNNKARSAKLRYLTKK